MSFTKLDSNILQSSIMSEPGNVFKVWIGLLAACGPDGLARVSATYISAVCYLPLAEVEAALARLSGPDPQSRSVNDEGRRIERVDGGYRLVNYAKYRQRWDYSETPDAIRQRRSRENRKSSVTMSQDVTPMSQDVTQSVTMCDVYASASSSDLQEEVSEGKPKPLDPHAANIDAVIDFLNQTCKTEYRKGTEATRKVIRARLSDGATVEDCKAVIRNQHRLWAGTDQEKYLRPETLFRASKFESYLADAKRSGTADGGEDKWQ